MLYLFVSTRVGAREGKLSVEKAEWSVADNPIGDTYYQPTVISGGCRSPSAGMSAQSRSIILMVKNETVA